MKRYLGLAIALVIGFSAAAFAQEPGDAVSVDPDVHNLILENEHFRVFDARASRGTKSPMHSHPPRVLISVGKTRLRMTMPDGKTDILITEAFRWAFERDRYGYAAAYSTLIFLILLSFTLVTNKVTGATKGAFE